jgi:hypothetical protein
LLSKSFTGLSVEEFDNIYNKEMTKRYDKYEIRRLSKRKGRKRDMGAVGRPFKLDLENRFIMLLVYHRLYINYALAGFLFDLDQITSVQRYSKDIILNMIRQCVYLSHRRYTTLQRG